MSTSKFKTLVGSLSLISYLLLIGCGKKNEEAPVLANAPVDTSSPIKPPVAVPVIAPSEDFKKLGLFTGKFEPNEDFKNTREQFDKWFDTVNEETITELSIIPAQFRSYVHKDPLYGYYTFIMPNRLSIVIDEMRDDNSFLAHSISAGNQRLITGSWKQVGKNFQLTGSEPGDDANDGSFEMTLSADGLNGNWTPKTGKATAKAFTLTSSKFEYDPTFGQNRKESESIDLGDSEFDKNPSIDKLSSKDVENLTQPHIRVIRNLIFARHGYSFKGKDLRLTFENYDWYTPVTNDVKDQLTEVEKANIALLNRYEKYADKHYDEFGR